MNIDEIKNSTAAALGVSIEDLDYITEEEVLRLADAAEETDDGLNAEGEKALQAGVYCNSIVYDPGSGGNIRYKRGPKGTPDYGCGSDPYYISKVGTTVQQIGSCSGGRTKYLVSW